MVKTQDLIGIALDWAVAEVEGIRVVISGAGKYKKLCYIPPGKRSYYTYTPATNWKQGGPIIERERIGIWPSGALEGMWAARPDYEVFPERRPPSYGVTPLIAAMRCYVTSKMGEEVKTLKELT